MSRLYIAAVLGTLLLEVSSTLAGEIPTGSEGFKSAVAPLFSSFCVKCHGPTKSKGKVTLHTLDGDLSTTEKLDRWEAILRAIKSGEMPPESEPQPTMADRKAVLAWIDASLRASVEKVGRLPEATTRRLTNFEYQNTMRDLLGFELKLSGHLSEDPVKPYRFNNSAEFMLIGPEQMDRYLENARRAMASAIVDPVKPEIHKTAKAWPHQVDPKGGLAGDEIGVYGGGGGRFGVAQGMHLKSWPKTGEFRIRIKAAAILPEGFKETPFRLVMGYALNENLSTLEVEPVGTVRLENAVDDPKVFEFRGRIENFPVRPAAGKNGPTMAITPQNLFDNGELNDHRKSAFDASWSLEIPRAVVSSIEFEAPIADVWPPEHHTRILFESPLRKTDPPAYVKETLKRFMSRAFRRPVAPDELERFVKVYNLFAKDFGTLEEAMRETLAMVLVSPQFLYHVVAKDKGATRQYELASKLSYFLWGSMPDDELLALAEGGRLDDPAMIETQVRRLLADKRSGDFVNNFTTQWLSIAKARNVNINRELFPRFLYCVHVGERKGKEVPNRPTIRDYMHAETLGFVGELIKRNAGVANLVDSDFAFLNQPLAAHYGVQGVQGNELRPVAIGPEHHLGGLLTQGSVLIGNSTGSAPHPIYRAVWLREAILGEEVKPPPAEVPALADTAGDAAAKAVTIKDHLRRHRKQESCNVCHASLDPWGIPFERYNAIGKYQPLVPAARAKVRGFVPNIDKDLNGYAAYLKSINTETIHADAQIPGGPTIDGMQELKAYLLKERKDEIAEAVLRKLLTYGMGRALTPRDRPAVETLLRDSKSRDYRLKDMIVAICQSETFRGRSELKGKK